MLSASSNLLDPLPPTFTSFIKAFKPPQSANSNANNSLLLEQSENKSLNLLDSYGKFGNGVNEKAADLSIAKATDPNQDRAIQDVPNVESAHPHTRSYPVKDPERKDPQNYPSST
ncbi:MAG: hypothetical protein JST59_02680 [Actinobacteria bacterium]|nr:hypothetical protein [Actinomycetota bacterium]